MRVHSSTLVALIIAIACSSRSPAVAPDRQPVDLVPLRAAASTITTGGVHERIAYLASDELGGRDTPSPGLEKAAAFIAQQFAATGLEPAGDSGTFVQRWPYPQVRFDPDRTSLTVRTADTVMTYRAGIDFFMQPGQRASVAGELLYAGTAVAGLRLAENARGKVVALYMPGSASDASWTAALSTAAGAAWPVGAGGVVLILDPALDDAFIGQVATGSASRQVPIYIVGLRYAAARDVFTRAGLDLDRLREQEAAATPLPGVVATMAAERSSIDSRPPNVIGMVRGTDPVLRDEYIVISAHMDHVGIGRPDAAGDSIYNGADDDASGTAAMIAVAEAFATLPGGTRRSILFLAVSGEEKGLLGSSYFTDFSPVPRERIVANINLDMIGRNAPDTVVAIGRDYTTLGDAVQRVARRHPELGLVVAPDLWPREQLFFRSDHFSFAKHGIPAIFFTTGLHADYHRPSDHVELIDADKVTRIARLVFYLAHDIAVAPEKPAWTESGRRAMGGLIGR